MATLPASDGAKLLALPALAQLHEHQPTGGHLFYFVSRRHKVGRQLLRIYLAVLVLVEKLKCSLQVGGLVLPGEALLRVRAGQR